MSTDIQTFGSSSINYPVVGDSVGRTSQQAVPANPDSLEELSQLETIMASITPSPAPAKVFDDLGAACAAVFGGECTVELVEDAGEPYRLSWPGQRYRSSTTELTILRAPCGRRPALGSGCVCDMVSFAARASRAGVAPEPTRSCIMVNIRRSSEVYRR
jgi:hypothetical protein